MDSHLARRTAPGPRAALRPGSRRAGPAAWMAASAATLLLVVLTGLPARSVPNLLPQPEDRHGPHIGM
ncbi:hypothetical protein [Methylobacterium sp. sgz302541]|uniref:hypothetical protein n=1 Tax=unclassified Methylobacterium TaxID=2615210 RepID=UPI003D346194